MDQEPTDQHQGAGEIDLNKILLPKKDAPSVDSAQRVDAGSLYTQEQTASLPKVQREPASAPASAASDTVHPLQTFQGDIARAVKENNVSVVSIAAAEATRRGQAPLSAGITIPDVDVAGILKKTLFVGLGLLLLGGAGGVMWYALVAKAPLPPQARGVAPFIAIDETAIATLPQDVSVSAAMQILTKAKNDVSLSLGLVAQLYIQTAATSSKSEPSYVDTQTLFGTLAPDMPQGLARAIQPVYLLGVHSYGINQPFLILKVDSYEQGYAGMLSWEPTLKKDLYPLFAYTPAPKIQVVAQPSQNFSSDSVESGQSSTTASLPEPIVIVQTGFADKIVHNHDARVLLTADNQIYLLWTFLDRTTLIITTNEGTLHEVITRLTDAPIVSLPNGQ